VLLSECKDQQCLLSMLLKAKRLMSDSRSLSDCGDLPCCSLPDLYFWLFISQLPKLCVKISILRHRRMVRSFSTRLTSVTFAEGKVLIFLIFRKNAKIVQL